MLTIFDISEGGCFFFGGFPHKAGEILELEIRFPILEEYMRFRGEVKRCEQDKTKHFPRYGLAVQFIEMDEQKKKQFVDTINFFLKKQQKE